MVEEEEEDQAGDVPPCWCRREEQACCLLRAVAAAASGVADFFFVVQQHSAGFSFAAACRRAGGGSSGVQWVAWRVHRWGCPAVSTTQSASASLTVRRTDDVTGRDAGTDSAALLPLAHYFCRPLRLLCLILTVRLSSGAARGEWILCCVTNSQEKLSVRAQLCVRHAWSCCLRRSFTSFYCGDLGRQKGEQLARSPSHKICSYFHTVPSECAFFDHPSLLGYP